MKNITLRFGISTTLTILAASFILSRTVKAASSPTNIIGNIESGYGKQKISFSACLGLYDAYGGIESVQIGFTKATGNFTGYYYVVSNGTVNTKNTLYYDSNWDANRNSNDFPSTFKINNPDLYFTNYTTHNNVPYFYVGLTYNPINLSNLKHDGVELDKYIISHGGQKISAYNLPVCSDSTSKVKLKTGYPPLLVSYQDPSGNLITSTTPVTTKSDDLYFSTAIFTTSKNPKNFKTLDPEFPKLSVKYNSDCSVSVSSLVTTDSITRVSMGGYGKTGSIVTISAVIDGKVAHLTTASPCKNPFLKGTQ